MNKKIKELLVILFIFFLLGIIFTYPLIVNFITNIYAQPGDPLGTLYGFWWSIYHQLDFSFPHAPLAVFLTQVGSQTVGEIITYNTLTILGFILTGLAGYLLVKKITKNQLAGFFSGLILTIAPFRIAHAMQHITFADLSLILFFIYFLISSREKPNFKNIFLSAVFLVSTTLYNYQYGFFAGIILLVFLIWILLEWAIKNKFNFKQFNSKIISYILFSFIFSVAVIGFFNYSVFSDTLLVNQNEQATVSPTRDWHELSVYSARWFNYILPSPENPVFGKFTKPIYDNLINEKGTNLTEQTLYLGWIGIGLAVYGIWCMVWCRTRKKSDSLNLVPYTYFFILLGLIGLYFSLAPTMNIFGHEFKAPAYYIFPHFPFFRVYARFGLLVMISVSVLAGIGLTSLLNNIKSKKWTWVIFIILCILSMAEFLNIPPTRTIDVSERAMPQVYQYLKTLPSGILVEYPLLSTEEPKSYDYLLWQRYHQFPLIYGASINSIGDNLRKTILNPSDDRTISKLKELGIKYVIIHEYFYTQQNAKKYPAEYNNGVIPQVNSDQLKLLERFDGNDLYVIN